jgi:cell division transport system permease protein
MHKSKKLNSHLWSSRGATPVRIGIKEKCKNYLKYHKNACKISLSNILNKPLSTLLIALAIGIGLSMPATLFLAVKNLRSLSPEWSNQIIITVLLKEDASLAQAQHLHKRYQQLPFLSSHKIITKEEALNEFEQHSGFAELTKLLPENPLPHMLHLQFDTDIPMDTLNNLKQELSNENIVDNIIFERDWIEKLQGIVRLGESLFDSLAILIALGVTFMIGTLIRLTLERHKEEVEVLHLIGATAHFIRRPFLYRGLLIGVMGGMVSLLILTSLSFGIEARANQLISLFNGLFILKKLSFSDTLILLGLSALLGWLGAWLAFAHNQKTLSAT